MIENPTIVGMNDHARIEDIWLMREEEDVVVYVKKQGVWHEAIRERAESLFDHCITSHGLMQLNEPAKWQEESS